MIKAYRDTWTLGVHSYLAYLRDRFVLCRELLADSGSIFVQIGDENVHTVRAALDEVFSAANLVAQIAFKKTTAQTSDLLPEALDYLLWYARDITAVKYRQIYRRKEIGGLGGGEYQYLSEMTGATRRLTEQEQDLSKSLPDGTRVFASHPLTSQRPPGSFPVAFQGRSVIPRTGYWKSGQIGMARLVRAERAIASGSIIKFRRYFDDFVAMPIANYWEDTSSGASSSDPKVYIVQTATRVVQRCLLMTTDPGDLVLDPTCGSGTTAYVAEQWGRRWITIDSSRVALAIARQRLLTSR